MTQDTKHPAFGDTARRELYQQRVLVLDGPLGDDNGTLLATQLPRVLKDDFARALPSERVLVLQSGFGASFPLPHWPLAPDRVIPHFNVTFPQVPAGDRDFRRADIPPVQWDMDLGLGWDW